MLQKLLSLNTDEFRNQFPNEGAQLKKQRLKVLQLCQDSQKLSNYEIISAIRASIKAMDNISIYGEERLLKTVIRDLTNDEESFIRLCGNLLKQIFDQIIAQGIDNNVQLIDLALDYQRRVSELCPEETKTFSELVLKLPPPNDQAIIISAETTCNKLQKDLSYDPQSHYKNCINLLSNFIAESKRKFKVDNASTSSIKINTPDDISIDLINEIEKLELQLQSSVRIASSYQQIYHKICSDFQSLKNQITPAKIQKVKNQHYSDVSKLPKDIWILIFELLNKSDLALLSRSCDLFYQLIKKYDLIARAPHSLDNELDSKDYDFHKNFKAGNNFNIIMKYLLISVKDNSSIVICDLKSKRILNTLYVDLKNQYDAIKSITRFSDKLFIVGTEQGLIKIYDVSNYQCIKNIGVKGNLVKLLILPNNVLACVSYIRSSSVPYYLTVFDTKEFEYLERHHLETLSNEYLVNISCISVPETSKIIFDLGSGITLFNVLTAEKLKLGSRQNFRQPYFIALSHTRFIAIYDRIYDCQYNHKTKEWNSTSYSLGINCLNITAHVLLDKNKIAIAINGCIKIFDYSDDLWKIARTLSMGNDNILHLHKHLDQIVSISSNAISVHSLNEFLIEEDIAPFKSY